MTDKLIVGTPEYHDWALEDNFELKYAIIDPHKAHVKAEKRIEQARLKNDGRLNLIHLGITHIPKSVNQLESLKILLILEFYTKIDDILKMISDTLFPSDITQLFEFGLKGLELSP